MSKLYKKDYVKIADILNRSIKYSHDKASCINFIIDRLSDYFIENNKKFDKDFFVNAVLK